MNIFLVVLHVILALGIIGLVLLQKGNGAGEGASFGGGASSVFGASGSSNFLSRTTAILATAFFINSLVLAHLAANRDISNSVLDGIKQGAVTEEVKTPVESVDEDVPVPVEISETMPAPVDASSEEVPLPD